MTPEETRHFDNKIGEVLSAVKTMSGEVAEIKRGVYGDPANKVRGLIETDRDQDERIKSLEDSRKKALWVGGAVISSMELAWHGFKEWINK